MRRVIVHSCLIILVVGAIGLGLWLLNNNFPSSDQIVITATLGSDRPMISSLGPPSRLKLDYPHQLILDKPVYFDLRSMPWFTRARIELVYREEGRTLVSMAGKVGEPWQYATFKPFVVTTDTDGWQHAIFDVDLTSLYHPKNVRRFLIDTDGPVGAVLRLKTLQVILQQ